MMSTDKKRKAFNIDFGNLSAAPAAAAGDADAHAKKKSETAPGMMVDFVLTRDATMLENSALKSELGQIKDSIAAIEAEAAKKVAPFEGALVVKALDTATIRRSQWANRNLDEFNSPEFAQLRAEIANAKGNTQPIKVRRIPGVLDGQAPQKIPLVEYEIVFGHRRYQACKEEGLPVNAVIVDAMTDLELFEAMERENRGRKNLSAWEQGTMYQDALRKELYPSARKLFEKLGVNDSDGTRAIQLAKLPVEVVQAFHSPLDLQYRWAKPLSDAMLRNPDVVLATAKAIENERKGGAELAASEVFTRLVGLEVAKAVSKVVKVGSKSFTITEKAGQISYQFDKLDKSKREQIEKFIKGVLTE
jgi:ParB family chromosome partitioning protein